MNRYMKFSLFSRALVAVFVAVFAMANLTGCTEQEELGAAYGYVQFRLFKNDTAPKASASRAEDETTLEYLSEACKVGVSLQRPDFSEIEQTLVLRSYSEENAAYGVRSDKLQLLAGDYKVTSYKLYNKLDSVITIVDDLS